MVIWIQATRSAASVPLGACAALIPADSPADDQALASAAIVKFLCEQAAGRPIVIGVDDANFLDAASVSLVLHLARTGTAFIVATVRTSEPCPAAIEFLWTEAGAERLDLGPLSRTESDELVESVLRGPVEEGARSWAFNSTEGNVLHLHELIAGAIAQGAFEREAWIWRLVHHPKPSASLSGLVEERLADLPTDQRRAIELLALGEPLRVHELRELVGASAMASVEGLGLIRGQEENAGRELSLTHHVYGDVVRASLPTLRGAMVRRDLAETIGHRPDHSPRDDLRIARWLLDAGEHPPTAVLLPAAAAALRGGDPEFARVLGRLARDAGCGAAAVLLIGRACARLKRYEEAEAVLAPLEGTFTTREEANSYLQQRVLCLLWGLKREEAAMDLLERARSWWPDPAWSRGLTLNQPRLVRRGADYRAAAEVSAELLAAPGLDPHTRQTAQIVHPANLFYSGEVRAAHTSLKRVRPAVPLRDENEEGLLVLACAIRVDGGVGDERDDGWMHSTFDDAMRVGDGAAAGIAAGGRGARSLLEGKYVDARRWLGEAVVHLADHDFFRLTKLAHAQAAGVAYYDGSPEEVAAAMERCRASTEGLLVDIEAPYMARAEAWLALAEGDPPRAQKILIEAAEASANLPLYAIQLFHEAVLAGAPARKVHDLLSALHHVCDAPLITAHVDDIAARAAGEAAAVLAVAEDYAELGAVPLASECAAVAAGLFAEAGRQDSARRAAALSTEFHGRCQGGSPPAIGHLATGADDLTPREAQLAALAARGLTSVEIAERLGLSVRTVESHIYRAMQKMGVTDRRELRA
jgi:DNA-binding NarL/FixJ family response regulator